MADRSTQPTKKDLLKALATVERRDYREIHIDHVLLAEAQLEAAKAFRHFKETNPEYLRLKKEADERSMEYQDALDEDDRKRKKRVNKARNKILTSGANAGTALLVEDLLNEYTTKYVENDRTPGPDDEE